MVIVDWLGRGGIAHTTEAWVRERSARGRATTVVTRAGRELDQSIPDRIGAGSRGGALIGHAAVVRAAARVARERSGGTIVLQGSVLPQLELHVARAARRAGNPVVLVAHEASVTRRSPGAMRSFAALVRSADLVIAHSHFVADEVSRHSGRGDIEVLPLPLPLGLLELRGMAPSVLESSDEPVALNFGNLHRTYKGSTTVLQVAERGVPGWRVALVGTGAPEAAGRAETVRRFLGPAELVATVAESAVALLPYTRASQSAAVVLAQALATPVIASSVGGIPEQIKHGTTGLLVAPGARPGRLAGRHLFALRPQRARGGSALLAPRALGKHINGLPRGLLTCPVDSRAIRGLQAAERPAPPSS